MTTPVIRRSPAHTGRVIAVDQLTPRMRRVTVQADSMAGVEIRPAQDVELLLREQSGRRVKRRYTIRSARPHAGELDLDVLLHGAGPGSTWGATAAPGDEVQFQGPRGKLQLTSATWHLLVGDESALPADEAAIAVIEVHDADDELPIRGEMHWVHRGEHAPGTPELLVAAVEALPLPDGAGHGYLMGETRTMVALRAVLEQRGLPHEDIFVKGYWNIGRPDRIAGRAPHPA
jgi:NADPH-dependent ferric siderophore reductase